MSKSSKCVNGSDYPKEKILELIDTFNLTVDLDRWDEKGKRFMRIESREYPDTPCIILYKDNLEVEVYQEKEFLKKLFQNFWIEVGERELKKKYNALMSLEK